MKIREETFLEVRDMSIIVKDLRCVVEEGSTLCLYRGHVNFTLSYEEWNRLLDLAEIGIRHEVK